MYKVVLLITKVLHLLCMHYCIVDWVVVVLRKSIMTLNGQQVKVLKITVATFVTL